MVTKQRSPNYPGISLVDAVDATARLYENVKRGEFSLDDAASAWGYGSASGPVRIRIGALRQYGLIEGKKGANPKLARLGLVLCIRQPGSREYQDAIREAALNPPLFKEMQETKADAADGALQGYLILEKNFTEDGASRFVDVYKATMTLSGLDEAGLMPRLYQDELDAVGDVEASDLGTEKPVERVSSESSGSRSYSWPLSKTVTAELTLIGPDITPRHVDLLVKYLELTKDALQENDTRHGEDTPS